MVPNRKKAQVWIETVIYTLIAFSLIAAVLAFAKPKIDEMQDKAVIEQSIGLVKAIDSLVREVVQGGAGNKRGIDVTIKDGMLRIDGEKDEIIFEIDSSYVYSEIGKDIPDGNLIIRTEKKGNANLVTLSRDYTADGYDIKFNGKDELKTLSKASTSYKLFITNNGKDDTTGKWNINIELS